MILSPTNTFGKSLQSSKYRFPNTVISNKHQKAWFWNSSPFWGYILTCNQFSGWHLKEMPRFSRMPSTLTHSSLQNSSFLSLSQFGVEYLKKKKKKSLIMPCYYLSEQLQSFNILLEEISLQRKSHLPSHILWVQQ